MKRTPPAVEATKTVIGNWWSSLQQGIVYLNQSKIMTALLVILVNIASRHAPLKVTKAVEYFFQNNISSAVLVFAIAWIPTRDTWICLAVAVVTYILLEFVFNEASSFCVLDKQSREYFSTTSSQTDTLTEEEIRIAKQVLDKLVAAHQKMKTQTIPPPSSVEWS